MLAFWLWHQPWVPLRCLLERGYAPDTRQKICRTHTFPFDSEGRFLQDAGVVCEDSGDDYLHRSHSPDSHRCKKPHLAGHVTIDPSPLENIPEQRLSRKEAVVTGVLPCVCSRRVFLERLGTTGSGCTHLPGQFC